MNINKIEEIQKQTVQKALLQVWNEMQQEFENRICEKCRYFEALSINGEIECKKFGIIECNKEFDYDFGCNKWSKREYIQKDKELEE